MEKFDEIKQKDQKNDSNICSNYNYKHFEFKLTSKTDEIQEMCDSSSSRSYDIFVKNICDGLTNQKENDLLDESELNINFLKEQKFNTESSNIEDLKFEFNPYFNVFEPKKTINSDKTPILKKEDLTLKVSDYKSLSNIALKEESKLKNIKKENEIFFNPNSVMRPNESCDKRNLNIPVETSECECFNINIIAPPENKNVSPNQMNANPLHQQKFKSDKNLFKEQNLISIGNQNNLYNAFNNFGNFPQTQNHNFPMPKKPLSNSNITNKNSINNFINQSYCPSNQMIPYQNTTQDYFNEFYSHQNFPSPQIIYPSHLNNVNFTNQIIPNNCYQNNNMYYMQNRNIPGTVNLINTNNIQLNQINNGTNWNINNNFGMNPNMIPQNTTFINNPNNNLQPPIGMCNYFSNQKQEFNPNFIQNVYPMYNSTSYSNDYSQSENVISKKSSVRSKNSNKLNANSDVNKKNSQLKGKNLQPSNRKNLMPQTKIIKSTSSNSSGHEIFNYSDSNLEDFHSETTSDHKSQINENLSNRSKNSFNTNKSKYAVLSENKQDSYKNLEFDYLKIVEDICDKEIDFQNYINDQKTNKYVTDAIEYLSDTQIAFCLAKIISNFKSVVINKYSCIFFQQLLQYLNLEQRSLILSYFSKDLYSYCIDRFANRALQAYISTNNSIMTRKNNLNKNIKDEILDSIINKEVIDREISITKIFSSKFEVIYSNQVGVYVLIKIIEKFSLEGCSLLKNYIEDNLANIITNSDGLILVKCYIDKINNNLQNKQRLINIVAKDFIFIAKNKFGHYGICHLLDVFGAQDCYCFCDVIASNINDLIIKSFCYKIIKKFIRQPDEVKFLI